MVFVLVVEVSHLGKSVDVCAFEPFVGSRSVDGGAGEAHLLQMKGVAAFDDPEFRAFASLVAATPALAGYRQRMFARHAGALASALQEKTAGSEHQLTRIQASVLARSVMNVLEFTDTADTPRDAVRDGFDLVRCGWAH